MSPEHDTVRFTLAGLDLEWSGTDRSLVQRGGSPSPLAVELYADVIGRHAGTHIPAQTAIRKAAAWLALTASDLRVISSPGETIPEDGEA